MQLFPVYYYITVTVTECMRQNIIIELLYSVNPQFNDDGYMWLVHCRLQKAMKTSRGCKEDLQEALKCHGLMSDSVSSSYLL